MEFLLNPAKATQAAALLLKLNDGKLNYTKLIKLLYLSDRYALKEWNRPIIGGEYVSMDNGPVLSEVYDWIKGKKINESWDNAIRTENYDAILKTAIGDDELSQIEIETLKKTDKQFKKMTFGRMIDYCHDNLKEWESPKGTSIQISFEHLLSVLGKKESEINKIKEDVEAINFSRKVFGH